MKNKPLSEQQLHALLSWLARQESFVLLETTRVTLENHQTLLFVDPVERLIYRAGQTPELFFKEAEGFLARGYYLAGWLAYELGYALEPALAGLSAANPDVILADLGVFRQPFVYNHRVNLYNHAGPWPAGGEDSDWVEGDCRLSNIRFNQLEDDYLDRLGRIKSYIEAGDTYQVNYTLKLLFDLAGTPESLYATLRRNQSVGYGAYIKTRDLQVMSFSPELFFRKTKETCLVRPMMGTIRRGRTLAEDGRLADFLKNDSKNRSENVMIVDLLRNDLGRLSRMGTVSTQSLFDIETYETLHQMTSAIIGDLRPGVSLLELFSALFPCGSVTGAPKIRTMEIIRELETEDRGIYTGGIGYLSPSGEAVFSVPIRTVVLRDGQGEMGIGSGIVSDSDPAREWQECQLKAKFLTHPAPVYSLIETLLWEPGKGYWLLTGHIERLKQSAGYFGYPLDLDAMVEQLQDLADGFSDAAPQRVRLALDKEGRVTLTAAPCRSPAMNLAPAIAGKDGLPQVTFSRNTTDSQDVFLFHKTTRRHLYDQEREKALAAGYYEVLFVNEKQEITEGSITNIFIRDGDTYYTPPVECGLLAGVFRDYFIRNSPLPVREKVLTSADIARAESVFLGNSVRGLVQVGLREGDGGS